MNELKKYIGEIIEEREIFSYGVTNKYYSFNPNKNNNYISLDILDTLNKIPQDIRLSQTTLTEFYKIGYTCYPDKIFDIMDFLICRGIKFCYHHLMFAYDLEEIIPELISTNVKNQINKKIMEVGLTSKLSFKKDNTQCYGDGCVCEDWVKLDLDSGGSYSLLEKLGKNIENFEKTRDHNLTTLTKQEHFVNTSNLYRKFAEKIYDMVELGIPFVEETESNYPISLLKSSLFREYTYFPNDTIKICFDAVNDVCGYNILITQALDVLVSEPTNKIKHDTFISTKELQTLYNTSDTTTYFECLMEFFVQNDKDEDKNNGEFYVPISLDDLIKNIDTVYWCKKSDDYETDYELNLIGRVKLDKETEQYIQYIQYNQDDLDYLYFCVKSYWSDAKSKVYIEITPSSNLSSIVRYALRIDEIKSIIESHIQTHS